MSKKVAIKRGQHPFAFPSPARAWQVAKLAAILATQHPFTAMDESSNPSETEGEIPDRFRYESSDELDDFYLSKVHLAEKLLDVAEKRQREQMSPAVFAHTLFDPSRRYSALDMADIFRSHSWKGLTSPNSVRKVLKKCISDLTQHYEDEVEFLVRLSLQPDSGKETSSAIEKEIKAIQKRFTRKPIDLEIVDKEQTIADDLKESIKGLLHRLKELDENTGADNTGTYSSVGVYAIFDDCIQNQLNWESLAKLRDGGRPMVR